MAAPSPTFDPSLGRVVCGARLESPDYREGEDSLSAWYCVLEPHAYGEHDSWPKSHPPHQRWRT